MISTFFSFDSLKKFHFDLDPESDPEFPWKEDLDLELPVKSDRDPKKTFRIRHTAYTH